ncbi:MAG: TonB-dependent receptor [Gammaproteobacteria bacterium]|nr:TonB-dependent receptor [Gammaproteobacteria bacterium]MBU1482254.1 TonB-dependent receptor [Gammaproteobacteria bacterium]
MNKKLTAMSALSLVLSMSFVQSSYAEDTQAIPPATEPSTNSQPAVPAAETSAGATAPAQTAAPVAEAGKGGVTKKMLGEVVVTSTTIDDRFDSKRGEASNISNISGKKVDEEHGKNIVDVLESIPGVTAEVQSGDSVKIMLRGVEAQRFMGEKPGVAIIIDGVPVVERTGRVNIDLDNIDSIKVIKGGASYLFGEDALSGAVIITTKRGAKMAGYTASVETGSFNYRKGLARAGFTKNDLVGHIQVSKAMSDDFYDQGAWLRRYVDGKLQYLIDESSDIAFGFEDSHREKDSHGTVTGVTNALIDPRSATSGGKDYARNYDVELNKLNLTYSKDLGDNTNLMLMTYQYKDHTYGWQGPSGYLRDSNGDVLGDMSEMRDVYASGQDTKQTQRGLKSEWRKGGEEVGLMAGLDLQKFEDHGVSTYLVNHTTRSSLIGTFNPLKSAGTVSSDTVITNDTRAVYGEAKWQLSQPLALTLNGRYDSIKNGYTNNLPVTAPTLASASKTFNVLSERIGLNYAVGESSEIYSNISNGFRTPTASQMYGTTISPTSVVAGNPDLKPEKSWNREIGLRGKREMLGTTLDMDVAVFQIERNDFILNTGGQYTTTLGAASTNTLEQYQNIGGVRNRGLEAGIKTDSRDALSADFAYTWLDARFTRYDHYWLGLGDQYSFPSTYSQVEVNNTGNVVPRTPKHKVNMNVRYRPADHWTVTTELNAQSGIFADEMNVVWVGGRSVYNLMLTYEVKRESGMKFSAFARIDNVFNRYYYTTIRGTRDSNEDRVYDQEDPSITVNPGRVWTAGLSLAF